MRIHSLFFLLLLSPLAHAQMVTMTGKIEPVGGPTICQQGETHILECTGVFLKSSRVDLTQWEGKIATISGLYVGVTCDVYDVGTVSSATVQLEWSGNPTPGGSIDFQVCISAANPPHLFRVFASKERQFKDLGYPPGVQFIGDLYQQVCRGSALGCGTCTVGVPNNPALIGKRIYAQALGFPSFAELSNPVCITIQ